MTELEQSDSINVGPSALPLMDARQRLAMLDALGQLPKFRPKTILILMHTPLLNWATRRHRAKAVAGFFGRTYRARFTRQPLAIVGQIGVGAPAVATLAEDWIAHGATRIILIGMVASLSPHLTSGTLVSVTSAYGTDAVSEAYADGQQTVSASLPLHHQAWKTARSISVSTPYLTSARTLADAQSAGASVLEMEAAALLAVAQRRNVAAQVVGVVADQFVDDGWVAPESWPAVEHQLRRAYRQVRSSL